MLTAESPRRRLGGKSMAVVLGFGLLLMTGAGGWVLGERGLNQPLVAVDTEGSDVLVLVGVADAAVSLTWTLSAEGEVSIEVDAVNDSFDPNVPVAVRLRGDARFNDLPTGDHVHSRYLDPADPDSAQLVVFADPQGPPSPVMYSVTGETLGTWHDSKAGRRVAQLPRISTPNFGRVLTPEDGADAEWWVASAASVLRSGAMSAAGEELVHHFPSDPAVGIDVEQGWGGVTWVKREGSEGATEELRGGTELPSARLRWENPEEVTRAQRDVLLSGVLLGVAAALTIEGLLWGMRRPFAQSPRPTR